MGDCSRWRVLAMAGARAAQGVGSRRREVRSPQSRGVHGPDAEPFEARLSGNAWELSAIKSGDDDDTLKTLRKQGLTVREIADRTGLSKSTVARRLGDAE